MPYSKKNCGCKHEGRRSRSGSAKYKCRVCSKYHPLRLCHKFQAMTVAERQRCVREKNYCINCFAHDHQVRQCRSKVRCKHCTKSHHSMLHVTLRRDSLISRRLERPAVQAPSAQKPSPTVSPDPVDLTPHIRISESILLPTMCCILRLPEGSALTLRCLLNTGCPHSQVVTELVEEKGIEKHSMDDSSSCWLTLESVYDDSVVVEHLFRVADFDVVTPKISLPSSSASLFRNIALADAKFYKSDTIDVIIGMDLYNKIIIPGCIKKPGLPDAINSVFGYVITGTYSD